MTDQIIVQIQTSLAHHDRQIADLSEMITAQWKEIESLKRKLQIAQAKLNEMAIPADKAENLSASEIAANEKPPHY